MTRLERIKARAKAATEGKTCCRCGETLPLSSFHIDSNSSDGRRGACKSCRAIETRMRGDWQRKWREEHRGHYNAQAREYRKRKGAVAWNKEWNARYKAAHRRECNANYAVWRAIQQGLLTRQPCEVCGKPDANAHHDNYAHPLDVRWLCPSHHKRHHAALKELDK